MESSPIILIPNPGPGNGCFQLISFSKNDLPKTLLHL